MGLVDRSGGNAETDVELRVFESPGEEWDQFASRWTDLIFYQSVWSQVLKKGLGGQPLYFCLKEGGEIVAGLPGVLLDFRIFKILYASIPYGNVIGDGSYFHPFMELLEKEFRRRNIDQVRVTESPFWKNDQPDGSKSLSAKCSLLDLRGLDKEKVWKGYKKYIRRDIRKAQRSRVTLRKGDSTEDVKIFYGLYLCSMERNRALAKYPFLWFEALYEIVVRKRLGDLLLADMDQGTIAGMVLIYSPASTHYFHNGSRYEFLKLCPNELLIHFSLEEACEKGHTWFDFMGSDPGDLALIRFKEKWGSQSQNIHTYVKDYHPIRCKIWEFGKKMANSALGSSVVKMIRN